MIPIFADLEIPMEKLTGWLPGMIAFLFVVALLLTIWNAGNKAFGAKPPLDDQLKHMVKTLRGEIMREKNSALKEYRLKLDPVAARVEKSEHAIIALQKANQDVLTKLDDDKQQILAAGEDRGEKLHDRINDVLSAVSELRGQMSEISKRNQP
jgi:hypothetical protein